ncbi:MAG: DUF3298 domain-containing protein [Cyclobacteriaceae bacterium]
MKKSLIMAIILTSVISCDNSGTKESETNTASTTESQATKPLAYKLETKIKKESPCVNDECSKASVSLPKFSESQKGYEKVNDAIDEKVRELLAGYVMNSSAEQSINQIMGAFVKSYTDFKKEFPESKTPWYITLDSEVSYTSDDFISMAFEVETYSGGAHNLTETIYSNISTKGKEINKLSSFFRDRQAIKVMAEELFRDQKNIDADKSLSSAGYLFDKDNFELTDNFGFSDKGLVFYYNSYEIAAYSEGPTRIIIPFNVLNDNFRY